MVLFLSGTLGWERLLYVVLLYCICYILLYIMLLYVKLLCSCMYVEVLLLFAMTQVTT